MLKVEISFEALGTWNVVSLYGKEVEKEKLLEVSKQIKKRTIELDDQFSIFKKDSEISKRNIGVGVNNPSKEMKHLLKTAEIFYQESKGRFNVASGDLTILWKKALKDKKIPTKQEIIKMQKKIQTNPCLDFGGIVKGFALDEAVKIARKNNLTDFIFNFGGSVYSYGRDRLIGIQNPREKTGQYFGQIKINNQAVVTAGIYEQHLENKGVTYHHIVDTITGYPSQSGLISVTVIGDNAEILDALSTTVLLCGAQEGIKLIKAHNAEGIMITDGGDIYATENVKEVFYGRE